MAYASKEDIEIEYGKQTTTMVVDHGLDLVEIAETNLNDAIAANQPQTIIDDLTTAYTTAQSTYITEADETIDRNLKSAAGEIDGYIKSRYPRTWVNTPDLLVSLNVDIAVYRMTLSADWRTDEMKVRYDAAIKKLELIRDGLLDLHGEMEALEDGEEAPINTGGMQIGTWARS